MGTAEGDIRNSPVPVFSGPEKGASSGHGCVRLAWVLGVW